MSTHNIGFYEDLTKIIFELSSNIIKYAPYFFCWVFMVFKKIRSFSSSSRWVKRFSDKSWIFVCEEETRVNLTRIETMLERYDPSKVGVCVIFLFFVTFYIFLVNCTF